MQGLTESRRPIFIAQTAVSERFWVELVVLYADPFGGGLFDVLVTHLAPVRSMIEPELIWGTWLYYYYRFKAGV